MHRPTMIIDPKTALPCVADFKSPHVNTNADVEQAYQDHDQHRAIFKTHTITPVQMRLSLCRGSLATNLYLPRG